MSGWSTCMNNTFRDALMVKVGDFLAQNKIFQQRWTTATGTQWVLIVGDAHALISGQRIIFTAFAYVFQRIKFSLRVSGAFRLPEAVGCAPGGVGSAAGRWEPSSGASESIPGFASLESCSGDWCWCGFFFVLLRHWTRLLNLLLKGPLFWSKNSLTIDHQPDPASRLFWKRCYEIHAKRTYRG